MLEEEAYLRWWADAEALGEREGKVMKKVREKTKVFIDWFEEAEVESSSEEESD